ncbi:MAG: ATP synthase F1 subunit delta [Phycisphaerales bacterium]
MARLDRQADALARIYAGALFDEAEKAGGQEAIESTLAELEDILAIAREDAQFSEFLTSQILAPDKRRDSLRTIFNGKVSDLTLNFLLVLNDKGRLDHLGAVAAAYDERLQDRFGRIEVDVYTASPIDGDQASAIEGRLRDVLGKEPVLHRYVDETMLGGLRLRIGDQLVDASVATQLRRMRERLGTSGADEIRGRIEKIIDDASN